jgi:hypothetical protein
MRGIPRFADKQARPHKPRKTRNIPRPSDRNAIRATLIGDDICTALGMTAQSASPVLALCRQAIEIGHDPATPLAAYRGGTVSLIVRSIGEAAALEISAHGAGFTARHERRAGPYVRANGLGRCRTTRIPAPITNVEASNSLADRCPTCGGDGQFGYRNKLRGGWTWYCAAHRLGQYWADARRDIEAAPPLARS